MVIVGIQSKWFGLSEMLFSCWMRQKRWLTDTRGLEGREKEKLLAVISCNNTHQLHDQVLALR